MSKSAKIDVGPEHPAWKSLDDDDWNGATFESWLASARGKTVVLRPPETAGDGVIARMIRTLLSAGVVVEYTVSGRPPVPACGEVVPFRMEPETTRGTALWRETVRRLAEGPNTAKERGILRRRRARLRRKGEDKLWQFKTFVQRTMEHNQKMSDLANGALRRVTELLGSENKRLSEQNSALMDRNEELLRALSERDEQRGG